VGCSVALTLKSNPNSSYGPVMSQKKDPTSTRPSEHLKPPVQERSKKTLQRILEAGMALLDERGFQGVSMSDIASRAGVSVATVYTRFRDKKAFVDYVFASLQSTSTEAIKAHYASEAWQGSSVSQRIDHLIEQLVGGAVSHRGLYRALALRQLLGEKTPEEVAFEDEVTTIFADWLREGAEGSTEVLPEQAARTAVALVGAAVRSQVVLGITCGLSREAFTTELAKAVRGYVEAACTEAHDPEDAAGEPPGRR
jgi:AcrR family transcriptional regulator